MPFTPQVLAESTVILKDIGFGNSYFFVFAACVYHLYRKSRPGLLQFLILICITYYSLGVKFQAQFIIPIVLFFLICVSIKGSSTKNAIFAGLLTVVVLALNYNFTEHKSAQFRQLFDIAAIITEINDDSALPEYVKEYPGYSFDILKSEFNHKSVDSLIFAGQNSVYAYVSDWGKLQQLNSTFWKLITAHPILYLKHRLINFGYLVGVSHYSSHIIPINSTIASEFNIHTLKNNYLERAATQYLEIMPKILRKNWPVLLLILAYACVIWRGNNIAEEDKATLKYAITIVICFSLVLLFATMAADYRYYYIARLISFAVLPIALKSYSQKRIMS